MESNARMRTMEAAKVEVQPLVLVGNDHTLLETLAREAIKKCPTSLLKRFMTVGTGQQPVATSDVIILIDASKVTLAPSWLAEGTLMSVFVRRSGESRDGWMCGSCSHEFEALPDGAHGGALIKADFVRLVRVLRCPAPPCLGPGSYFVSLTFPDVTEAMSAGEDWKPPEWAVSGTGPLHSGLEVRADLLKSYDEEFVLAQLAMVRRRGEGQPIIYTVRSKSQGGAFPDDEQSAWLLMLTGIRFGVEYVDMEACWCRQSRYGFLSLTQNYPGLRVIGSYHEVQRPLSEVSDGDLYALFQECAHGPEGAIDIVKVVGRAESVQCSIRVNQTAIAVRSTLPPSVKSVIAICTTDAGRLSRALNIMLGPTPVAHPSLPGKAAPGQLSAVEIERIRQTLGLPSNPFVASALTHSNSSKKRRVSAD